MGSTPVLIWSASGRLEPLYDAEDATRLPVNLDPYTGATTVYPYGMVLGEVLASQGLYNWLNSVTSRGDGTQNPKGILEYRAVVTGTTGAAGSIAGVAPGVGGEWPGVSSLDASMFKSGDFDLAKIIGLGSGSPGLTNLATLAGRLVSGALGTDESDVLGVAGAASGSFGLTIPATTVNGYTYPQVFFANTTFSATQTAANLVTTVNAALLAAGIPAFITASGGPAGSGDITIVYHGAYGSASIATLMDASLLVSASGTVTRTPGTANYGIVRFG